MEEAAGVKHSENLIIVELKCPNFVGCSRELLRDAWKCCHKLWESCLVYFHVLHSLDNNGRLIVNTNNWNRLMAWGFLSLILLLE